jgi:hypothetical protein
MRVLRSRRIYATEKSQEKVDGRPFAIVSMRRRQLQPRGTYPRRY